ncbi:YncE family protein [Corynebacterium urealyticum]|uniref:YncE family protein n=1 Tax=Corynebacterium urealyticum TaxID=43771 RepID=UPI0011E7886E|nr:hypothetical protein [Corynebacterium urealyticum]TYR16135.1 hypothetical protein FYJ89_06585 [Corynebacterium urealyticum]TYT20222.1 hypothetical protein FYJ86_09360 [Corynebacterium urealyticum]
MAWKKPLTWAAAVTTTLGLGLAGCATEDTADNSAPEGSAAKESAPKGGTPATPAGSPTAKDPLGEVKKNSDAGEVIDVSQIGLDPKTKQVAALSASTLRIGTLTELSGEGEAKKIDVPEKCTTITPSADGVMLACEGELYEYGTDGKQLKKYSVDGTPTVATATTDGRVFVGFKGSNKLNYYSPSGDQLGESESIVVSRSLDDLVHVNNEHGEERLAVIDRDQTSITDIDLATNGPRGALRIGQGVGLTSVGRGDQGIFIAADTVQDQFQVFTLNDVVRQVQAAPTGKSPWAVLWDGKRQIAWVSTTGDNKVTGYRIDSGTPIQVASFDSIANVRHILDSPGGDMLLFGADGTTQQVSAADLDAAVERGVPGAEDFPVIHEDQ